MLWMYQIGNDSGIFFSKCIHQGSKIAKIRTCVYFQEYFQKSPSKYNFGNIRGWVSSTYADQRHLIYWSKFFHSTSNGDTYFFITPCVPLCQLFSISGPLAIVIGCPWNHLTWNKKAIKVFFLQQNNWILQQPPKTIWMVGGIWKGMFRKFKNCVKLTPSFEKKSPRFVSTRKSVYFTSCCVRSRRRLMYSTQSRFSAKQS